MNETQFGNRLRHLLDEEQALSPGAVRKLREARERALARQRPERAPGFAWADDVLVGLGGWAGASLRVFLPATALVLALAGIYTWQQKQHAAEIEEIDAELLADDLPIDAYLDRGFQNWLKEHAAERS